MTFFLEEYVGMVYRYAVRLTGRPDMAEELAQETLLRAWRNRERLRDPGSARVWLLRIASNLWKDGLRKSKFVPGELKSEPACPRERPAHVADQREQVVRALAAMDELPPRQRQVLYLITCEELSQSEVAEVLGIDIGAVRSNLSLARRQMRKRLKDVYDEVSGRPATQEKPT